jgi:hypothetical protein
MTQYFVDATRLSIALVNGRARQRELYGPFDDWTVANHYAIAWRTLWRAQRAKARVVVPLSPCDDVTEWFDAKVERDALPAWDGGGARTGLAMREAIADALFASEARE